MKSPEMSPPQTDTITNKDITRIITQQDPILPPLLSKLTSGYKPLIDDTYFSNKTEDKHNDSTDNSCTENKDSVNELNVKIIEVKDDEYKEHNSESTKSDESFIKKNE